jgi:8-oxo-dGTP diphosphatase
MFFRCERYIVAEGKADAFASFFVRQLLPLREKYGARLIGRWQTEDETEVLTIWAFASREAAEEVDEQVRDDPGSAEAQVFQERYLDPLFHEMAEMPLYSTVPLDRTALSDLSFRSADGPAGASPRIR